MDPVLIIQQALDARWPEGSGPEAKVKRAAAEYLLTHPADAVVKCVHVASHVTSAVGKVSALGITQKFEQLLEADPCFTLHRLPGNNKVSLNVTQLLSPSSLRADGQLTQHHQQQQGPHWQPQYQQQPDHQQQPGGSPHAPLASGSGGAQYLRATPRLLQGLQELWPLTGPSATPESRAKHAALMHLLQAPSHATGLGQLAAAVDMALGCSLASLGCSLSLIQVLEQERSIFMLPLEPHPPGLAVVALDARGVLNTFVRKQYSKVQAQPPQQQGYAEVPGQGSALPEQQQAVSGAGTAAAAADSGSVSVAELLRFVRSRRWHAASPVLDAARRALAERLVLKVNPGAAKDAGHLPAKAEAKWYTMLASLAGGCAVVFQACTAFICWGRRADTRCAAYDAAVGVVCMRPLADACSTMQELLLPQQQHLIAMPGHATTQSTLRSCFVLHFPVAAAAAVPRRLHHCSGTGGLGICQHPALPGGLCRWRRLPQHLLCW